MLVVTAMTFFCIHDPCHLAFLKKTAESGISAATASPIPPETTQGYFFFLNSFKNHGHLDFSFYFPGTQDRTSSLNSTAGTRTISTESHGYSQPLSTSQHTQPPPTSCPSNGSGIPQQQNDLLQPPPESGSGFNGSIDRRTLRPASSNSRGCEGLRTPSTTTTTLMVGHQKTSAASSNVFGDNYDTTDLILNADDEVEGNDVTFKFHLPTARSNHFRTQVWNPNAIELVERHLDDVAGNPSTDNQFRTGSNNKESIFHMAAPTLAMCCGNYLEDEDPEWRDLDYGADVGPPPESFFQFISQYDLGRFKVKGVEMNHRYG